MPPALTAAERDLLGGARRATLATIAADGRPRLVPICFVVIDDVVWTPIDEKRKVAPDVRQLARIRDIGRDPRVSVLVDHWSEDWSELAWARISGRAEVVDSDPTVVAALRAKYQQYTDHDLESRPMIRIEIESVRSWRAADSPTDRDPSGRTVD